MCTWDRVWVGKRYRRHCCFNMFSHHPFSFCCCVTERDSLPFNKNFLKNTPAAPNLHTQSCSSINQFAVCPSNGKSGGLRWRLTDWLARVQVGKALCTWTHSRWMTQWCSTSETRRDLMTLTCVSLSARASVCVCEWVYAYTSKDSNVAHVA